MASKRITFFKNIFLFLEIPTDPSVQSFLISFGDEIRQKTTDYKFNGNLSKEAKCLGLNIVQLNEALKLRGGVNIIARELFKFMVDENCRQVDSWNELSPEVLVKEKLLIGTYSSKSPA